MKKRFIYLVLASKRVNWILSWTKFLSNDFDFLIFLFNFFVNSFAVFVSKSWTLFNMWLTNIEQVKVALEIHAVLMLSVKRH